MQDMGIITAAGSESDALQDPVGICIIYTVCHYRRMVSQLIHRDIVICCKFIILSLEQMPERRDERKVGIYVGKGYQSCIRGGTLRALPLFLFETEDAIEDFVK